MRVAEQADAGAHVDWRVRRPGLHEVDDERQRIEQGAVPRLTLLQRRVGPRALGDPVVYHDEAPGAVVELHPGHRQRRRPDRSVVPNEALADDGTGLAGAQCQRRFSRDVRVIGG